MTEATLAAPSVRQRTRPAARQIDAGPDTTTPQDQAVEKAREIIFRNLQANKLSSEIKSLTQDLGVFMAENGVRDFTLTLGSEKFDIGTVTEIAQEVDVSLLHQEVTEAEFLKLVKATQGDVKDHGGDSLLNKVRRALTKKPEFKIKKQKKGS
jgi:hypothetical protein